MTEKSSPIHRCAIYTRKSSDEGLDQAFNSLDAQRDACAAYIASQKLEGWVLVDRSYDDGGLSGGSLQRPALQRLLTDIAASRVDVVVVYKIDRLTRSLADFAKLTELFERHAASFVSVTQQFNTSTSMGRLTLNVLLSFAQFEREVAGERIRDKIAASKKRGMWMGGHPPLGYRVQDRKLVPVPEEADRVTLIFRRYLELGSVRELKAWLDTAGYRSKVHVTQTGETRGGSSFSRGALYQILTNPIYRGLITHKGQTYCGDHTAIVPKDLFEQVQSRLSLNGPGKQAHTKRRSSALLAGLVFDDTGDKLLPSHSRKNGRRYGYYVSARLLKGRADSRGGYRIPAADLERGVLSSLQSHLAKPDWIAEQLSTMAIPGCQALAQSLDKDRALIEPVIRRITLSKGLVTTTVNLDALAALTHASEPPKTPAVDILLQASFVRAGKQVRIVIDTSQQPQSVPDPDLLTEIVRARSWFADLLSGKHPSISALARHHRLPTSLISRRISLAFLAPDITAAILNAKQPTSLTVERLTRHCPLPASWDDQRALLLD